jgi:asparagine synthase (glutamine-hydrolysing)
MCGIAGILSLRDGIEPPSLERLSLMVGAMQHRGPDGCGAYRDSRVGLGHARLSIIDLVTGQQPLSNEDGTLWIVFNGEIFNYLELRAELETLGHRFRTRSDTEVIVHAWEAWGEDAFRRFNGQWAVALWDRRSATLVLSRDPLGILPLCFCEHGGRLYFASEAKALFAADGGIPRGFDPRGLAEVFTFWSALPPRTVFAGVAELEPGHVRTYADGRVTDRAYASPRYPEGDAGRFGGTLSDAEAASRVALGFFTFSLRFADAEYDEARYQRLMVERLGSEHREITVTRADIARVFPDVIAHAERPILRTAPAPMFLLSKLVEEAGIKVVLTGEGADEMFAGYDLFREARLRRFWARQPESSARPRLLQRLYPDLARWQEPGFGHGPRWRSTAALQRLLSGELRAAIGDFDPTAALLASLPPEFARWTHLARDQYLECRTLLSSYLLSSQGDRMLMAHSVEGRFPYLDREVAALADSLPDGYKLAGLDEKYVVKRVARDLLPADILARKKQPYRAPDALSFVGPDAPAWVAEAMSERALTGAGVFDPGVAGQLYRKCLGRRDESQFSNADNMALVGILSTQLLHESFVGSGVRTVRPATFHMVADRLQEGPL